MPILACPAGIVTPVTSDPSAGPPVIVAAALLGGGHLLAAERSSPPELAGCWELPGGKVEPGEADEEALIRECREELGVGITLGRRIPGDFPLPNGAVLRVWLASVADGVPEPLQDHTRLRWLSPEGWYDVAWIPADLAVLDAIRRELRSEGNT